MECAKAAEGLSELRAKAASQIQRPDALRNKRRKLSEATLDEVMVE